MFLAGLAPRVTAALARQGARVQVHDDNRPRPHIQPDDIWVRGLDPGSLTLVTTLVRRRRGQLAVRGRADRVALVALLARALPRAGITVVFASRGQARDFHKRFRRATSEPVLLLLGGSYHAKVRLRSRSRALCPGRRIF
jgi:hypothetical protein